MLRAHSLQRGVRGDFVPQRSGSRVHSEPPVQKYAPASPPPSADRKWAVPASLWCMTQPWAHGCLHPAHGQRPPPPPPPAPRQCFRGDGTSAPRGNWAAVPTHGFFLGRAPGRGVAVFLRFLRWAGCPSYVPLLASDVSSEFTGPFLGLSSERVAPVGAPGSSGVWDMWNRSGPAGRGDAVRVGVLANPQAPSPLLPEPLLS